MLSKLRSMLCDIIPNQYNHRVALYGLGGVGKTQLALEYVHTQRSNYDRIYWISAVTQTTLFSGFQEIAKRTQCVPITTDLKPSDVATSVLEWLDAQENWLLVMDNVDDVTVVNGYLPKPLPTKHTLITTRNRHCDHIPARGLEVEVLNADEAVNLLLSRIGDVGASGDPLLRNAEAVEIVNELGRLPLAIEQAAAYIREASKNIFKFLPTYRKNPKPLRAQMSKGNHPYPNSVATTWRLSFQKIEQNNIDAIKVLRLLAFLNPDKILVDFLEAGSAVLDSELRDIITDSYRFYEALSELERFSLIRRQPDATSEELTMHRLVQAVIKDEIPQEVFSTTISAIVKLCNCAFPDSWEWTTHELRLQGCRYQDQVVMPLLSIEGISSVELGYILRRVGVFLSAEGKYQQATNLLAKAVDVIEATGGKDHPATVSAMAYLAVTYMYQERWDDAASMQEEVLHTRARLVGHDSPYTLMAMMNLGVTYCRQGRWMDGANLLENVLERMKILLGEEHVDTLLAMQNILVIYRDLGRFNEAAQLGEKILKVRRSLHGERHPDTLLVMASLGMTYKSLGRLEEAAALEEEVLETSLRLLGEQHPKTLVTMTNLARTYLNQGKSNDSLRLLERAIALQTRTLGEEHLDTLRTKTVLAGVYASQERFDESVILLTKNRETMKRKLGHEHQVTLWNTSWLGNVYRMQGKLDESIGLLKIVIETQARTVGHDHPDTKESVKYLEEAYRGLQIG